MAMPRYKKHDVILRAAIWGGQCTGKTSLFNRFIDNTFSERYESTIGFEFGTKILQFGPVRVNYQLWDASGQQRFRSFITDNLRGFWIFMLVYSIIDRTSFDDAAIVLDSVRRMQERFGNEKALVLLVGNKTDKESEQLRVVSTEEGKAFAESNGLMFVETSAASGHNVKLAFVRLLSEAYKRWASLDPLDDNWKANHKDAGWFQSFKEQAELGAPTFCSYL